MKFDTEPQKQAYERILPWVKELFGELIGIHSESPSLLVHLGSADVHVTVWPWGDDDATVTARSYVIIGAEVTPELMRFLLTENNQMRFGAFGLDKDGDIFFEHSIVGSTVDKEELKASILAVGYTADKYDDQIMGRWGGQRAIDRAS